LRKDGLYHLVKVSNVKAFYRGISEWSVEEAYRELVDNSSEFSTRFANHSEFCKDLIKRLESPEGGGQEDIQKGYVA
jgi:hypothetical protein